MRSPMLAVLAVVTLGCASSGGGGDPMRPPPEPPPMLEESGDGYTFRLRRDEGVAVAMVDGRQAEVFQALMSAYEALGMKIGGADRVRGLVQAEAFAAVRRHGELRLGELFTCGTTLTGDRAETWRLQIEVSSQAQAAGEETRLTTRAGAYARPVDGTSTNAVPCTTTGRLEQKIAETTAQRLRAAR